MSFVGDHSDDDGTFNWPDKNRYDLNSKIMLTAIISLSVVVIVVVILHIYARFILRRQARRHAIIRQLGLTTVGMEPPRTGLEPSVIATLPIFIFKQSDGGSDENGTEECAVCLSALEEEEMARFLPNCKHTFHVECIDKWLSSHSTCPICRTEAEPRLQPENREPIIRPTAPPLEGGHVNCSIASTSDGAVQSSAKVGGSISRLSSFRRMLSRERSSRRIQSCEQEDGIEDLERQ
ncbi:hypothetical protein L1049_024563 [Liquidambar formosana]|uniref:RING-type E3 ubiquitin transferase n=1 Tax=Liquidambar formosana TaxID=63359 RepID=A0AAP0RVF5_LIQFO